TARPGRRERRLRGAFQDRQAGGDQSGLSGVLDDAAGTRPAPAGIPIPLLSGLLVQDGRAVSGLPGRSAGARRSLAGCRRLREGAWQAASDALRVVPGGLRTERGVFGRVGSALYGGASRDMGACAKPAHRVFAGAPRAAAPRVLQSVAVRTPLVRDRSAGA